MNFCKLSFVLLIFFAGLAQADPPVIPQIDKAMRAQLKTVYKFGVSIGNHPSVFAKVGDSITRNNYFLKDIGCGVEVLASHQRLASTIAYFRGFAFPTSFTTAWCGEANSFTRDSLTSQNGWTVNEPLKRFANPASECPPPYDTPLHCELHLIQPSIALIMLGTNDLESNDQDLFRKKLSRIVQETMISGVVPVLSTIPPRLDNPAMGVRVGPYNTIIQEVAETLQVPLWNYWLSLQDPNLINQGMDSKGIHPNVLNDTDAAVFTSEGLRYGFNQRNFTAIEVLQKLRKLIQKSARSDTSTSSNFTMLLSEQIPAISRGTTATFKLKIARNNLTKPITFTLPGHPAGVSATFTTAPSGSSVMVNLTVKNGVKTGEHRITIQGISGNVLRTSTFALIVTN